MITKYNLSVPKEYEKDGQKKTQWQNVGTLTEFEKEGKVSRVVEIPAIGLRAQAFLVENKEKQGEEINSGDIPF